MALFFTHIKDIIQKVFDDLSHKSALIKTSKKGEDVIYVLDTSGSTGAEYSRNNTILKKEKDVICSDIFKNKFGHNYLSTFNSLYNRKKNYHGEILVDPEIEFVMLPDGLNSEGATYTADPLIDIVKLVKEGAIPHIDEVKIYTDGETNSDKTTLINIVRELKNLDIKVSITAISLNNTNLNKISINEGNNLVGMDLLLYLENDIYSYNVYNKVHVNTPFLGAINSNVGKKEITFFDTPLPEGVSLHMYIWDIIDNLSTQINWGTNDFIRFCAEIGKIISIFNITLSSINNFLDNISREIKKKTEISLDTDKIKKIIEYGFNCSRNKKPIILSAANERIISSVVKINQFSNAIDDLKMKGTTFGLNKRIAFSDKYVIIDNNLVSLTNKLGPYPKSISEHGEFVFFGLNDEESPEYEQAIRIGMREYCAKLGYPQATHSPSVIFHVANIMSIMFLKGCKFNSYMENLRKLAIIQTKMNRMIAPKTYGESFYESWKQGLLPTMHYSNKDSHSSLYKDKMINPLKLDESIWWALMMTMLDLFDEQLHVYESALNLLKIECKKSAFIDYMKRTYTSKVNKKMFFETFENKESVITLEPFPLGIDVFSVKDHGECKSKLWFSRDEIEGIGKKCVICRVQLLETDFCLISRSNNDTNKVLNDILTKL